LEKLQTPRLRQGYGGRASSKLQGSPRLQTPMLAHVCLELEVELGIWSLVLPQILLFNQIITSNRFAQIRRRLASIRVMGTQRRWVKAPMLRS